jgi:outer membrane lipoprotein-sorting protein
MTNQDLPDHADLVAGVVTAFERIAVPAPPGVRETIDRVERAAARESLARPSRFRRRLVAGGIGLSTLVALVLLLVVANAPAPLSAMARTAQELRAVKSYSYQVSEKVTRRRGAGKPAATWTSQGATYWRAPREFHSELKITESQQSAPGRPPTEKLVEHFAEIFPAENPGIFIDYKTNTYRRTPYEPIGSGTYPLETLRLIRENSGEVTRVLGSKDIDGREARGYVLTPKNSREKRRLHPLEVWVDAETDLPVEFGFAVQDASGSTVWKATDFRWNTELDPKLFEPIPPPGFTDVTPPETQKELDQIASALKLYADLSGGHFPRVRRFDSQAVRDEMLKLAGFDGPARPEWKDNPKFQAIEQAAPGLDWIARILRNRYHASYDGRHVGPRDKDKLLMWWRLASPERYCLIYGDLRTQIAGAAEGARLGLAEAYPDMTAAEPQGE